MAEIDMKKLNDSTNRIAYVLEGIKNGMQGKGINPAEVGMISSRLEDVVNKLRMIGADEKNPIPYQV
jgi:hypothetical protein